MIDANKGQSETVLNQYRQESYERFHIEVINAVKQLLDDFEMTWDDLAEKIGWGLYGESLKLKIGCRDLTMWELNDIAHVFSSEPFILFRPREPYTQN